MYQEAGVLPSDFLENMLMTRNEGPALNSPEVGPGSEPLLAIKKGHSRISMDQIKICIISNQTFHRVEYKGDRCPALSKTN